MKTFTAIMKILTALAAVAGAVYLIATYGDKIVAWAKKMLGSCCCDCCDVEEDAAPEAEEAAPEAPAEEPAAEEAPVEEPTVEEIVIEENEPVAAEEDFEA